MLIDPVFGAHDIFLEVLHAERPLIESNVERSYVTKNNEIEIIVNDCYIRRSIKS